MSLPESAGVCRSLPESTGVCRSLLESAKVHRSLLESAGVHRSPLESVGFQQTSPVELFRVKSGRVHGLQQITADSGGLGQTESTNLAGVTLTESIITVRRSLTESVGFRRNPPQSVGQCKVLPFSCTCHFSYSPVFHLFFILNRYYLSWSCIQSFLVGNRFRIQKI